jgi:hypothetical protein
MIHEAGPRPALPTNWLTANRIAFATLLRKSPQAIDAAVPSGIGGGQAMSPKKRQNDNPHSSAIGQADKVGPGFRRRDGIG